MNVEQITRALQDHRGTWDSWGWHCSGCDVGEEFAPMSDKTARYADRAGDALRRHQAEVITRG